MNQFTDPNNTNVSGSVTGLCPATSLKKTELRSFFQERGPGGGLGHLESRGPRGNLGGGEEVIVDGGGEDEEEERGGEEEEEWEEQEEQEVVMTVVGVVGVGIGGGEPSFA